MQQVFGNVVKSLVKCNSYRLDLQIHLKFRQMDQRNAILKRAVTCITGIAKALFI